MAIESVRITNESLAASIAIGPTGEFIDKRLQEAASESAEQAALIEWAHRASGRSPELRLLFHIPNGGSRGKVEAARFKAEGVKAGVPDLFLPVARGGYHGLFIELKRRKDGRISAAQAAWIEELNKQGYYAVVCYGWEDAAKTIKIYLLGGDQN